MEQSGKQVSATVMDRLQGVDPIALSVVCAAEALSPAGTSCCGSTNDPHEAPHSMGNNKSSEDAASFSINVLPANIGYFGFYFGAGAIFAYFGVIFTAKGMSSLHIGWLMALIPFFSVFLLPAVTYTADRLSCTCAILVICAAGSSLFAVVFLFTSNAAVAIGAFIAMVMFQTPMSPLLDQHTLSMLPKDSRMEKWGKLRSLGACGWGLGNPFAALIVQWAGSWSVASLQYVAGQLALLYCVLYTKPCEVVERTPMRFYEVLQFLLLHRRLLLFLFASCLMGMGFTFINTFLFVFLESLGASKLLMGLSLTVTVSTEIPIFQYSKDLHQLFTDRQMISLAMLFWSFRVLGYSFLQEPWMVLLLEPLHGITFGFMWLPGIHVVNATFPPHLASSATGFLYMFVGGIGPIVGNIVSGTMYEVLGPRLMFRIVSVVMFCGLLMYQLLDRILEGREQQEVVMQLESPRCVVEGEEEEMHIST